MTRTLCSRKICLGQCQPSPRGEVSVTDTAVWTRLRLRGRECAGPAGTPSRCSPGVCPLPSHLSISAESWFHLSTGSSEGLNPREGELQTRKSLPTGLHALTSNKVTPRSGSPTEDHPRMVVGVGSPLGRMGGPGHCPVSTAHTRLPRPERLVLVTSSLPTGSRDGGTALRRVPVGLPRTPDTAGDVTRPFRPCALESGLYCLSNRETN